MPGAALGSQSGDMWWTRNPQRPFVGVRTPAPTLVRRLAAGALALVAAWALAACGGGSSTTTRHDDQPVALSSGAGDLQSNLVKIVSRVSPEVVQISTPQGLGSGVVFDSQGDVVTNAHVIASGGPLRITGARGRTYPAKLVGEFRPDDLAVVRAQGGSFTAAQFGDSSKLQVGDIVLAIGNPLGLRSSVTDGIISALGRTVPESQGVILPNVIQTSAPINPGNSGGAVVNLQGKVVGIPTLAATDPRLGGAAPGIGFAIPSSVVTDIAGQIVKHGHVVNSHRAYLGIQLASTTSKAIVAAVQHGGAAAKVGIVPGDQITEIAGHKITAPIDVPDVLAALKPGQTVRVAVVKPSGGHATYNIKLGEYPGRTS